MFDILPRHVGQHCTTQLTINDIIHSSTTQKPTTQKYGNTKIGTFPWPWEEKGKPSALSEYGLGLVFYFKMLKSLAVLFAIISAVTIPSLGLYIASKARTNAESNYQIVTHSERLLGAKVHRGDSEYYVVALVLVVHGSILFHFSCEFIFYFFVFLY